jgi:hypothetical protein
LNKKKKKERYLQKFEVQQDDVNELFEEGSLDEEEAN